MTNKITLPSPWGALVVAYGGRKTFAKMLGVAEYTIYRWAHQQSKMSFITQKEIRRLAKRKGISISF